MIVSKNAEIASLQLAIKELELSNAYTKNEVAAGVGMLEEANLSFIATMQKFAAEKESIELQYENFKTKSLSSEAALENIARKAGRDCKILNKQLLKQQTLTYNSEQQCESLRIQNESINQSLHEKTSFKNNAVHIIKICSLRKSNLQIDC
jgi:hypothetical protein